MANTITTTGVHHLRLTVTNAQRSRAFYTELLGFQVLVELPSGPLLTDGTVMLGLGPAPQHPLPNDRFDENRVGLDHLSFTVANRDALVEAERLLNERGVQNGGVKDLGSDFGIYILAFRDPDNIQIELTAPYS